MVLAIWVRRRLRTVAAAAGSDRNMENSSARLRLDMASASSPALSWRDSSGNSAVPTATPITPSGNW